MMLDLSMLDLLARPPGAYIGPPAPSLEELFARVVADGWTPRNPAFGAELERLEISTTRGTCLEPIIFEGDEVFIDRNAKPAPGDLVSFALSERGAQANSNALRTCRKGDHWLKLYIQHHGFDMLLEKYGQSMTATLATLEDPDGDPIPNLHVVRNVRRGGRLLFTPETLCSQIGANAATSPSSSSYSTATTLTSTWQTFVSVTVVIPSGSNLGGVLATGNANVSLGTAPTGAFRLILDGSPVQTPLGWNSNMASQSYTVSFDYVTTLTAGSHTFSIQGINTSGGATFENASLTVTNLKR